MNACSSIPTSSSVRSARAHQVLAEHRFQLAGVPEAELAQQRPEGGGRVHRVEQDRHPARAQHVQVVDAVRAGAHPGDHAQQLRGRVRRPGLDPRRRDRHLLGDDLRQPGLLGQPEQRHQPRADTRLSSSKRAEPAVNLWETRTESAFPDSGQDRLQHSYYPSSFLKERGRSRPTAGCFFACLRGFLILAGASK